MNKPRIFVCIEKGMIWETAGDIDCILIIKNVDKQWIRHLEVHKDSSIVDQEEEIITYMEKRGFKPEDLEAEEGLHVKAYPLKKLKKKK